jgi:hypothetical protein
MRPGGAGLEIKSQCLYRFGVVKYRKSGGAWFFFVGINRPSALRK